MGYNSIKALLLTLYYRLVLSLVALTAFLYNPTISHSADYLTASGCSVSNVGYLTDLAKEYEKRTGVKILVRGGGSVVGIEDLRTGKVDFAAACRGKAEGDPVGISFIQVAWDALVFIVHKSNPVKDVSLEDVQSIYSAKIIDWRQLNGVQGPIKLFISRSQKGLSGVEVSINALLLEGKAHPITPNTLIVPSTGIVEQMVESSEEGFATTGYLSARKRNVKMLNVNGVPPTNKNIIQNKYPLRRPLYILTPKTPRPDVKKFIDFVLSREGQQYLRSLNVVTLLDIP